MELRSFGIVIYINMLYIYEQANVDNYAAWFYINVSTVYVQAFAVLNAKRHVHLLKDIFSS